VRCRSSIELEPTGRGLYGGTVGYFGARGDMDQAITIRTLVFRGDEYSYQAGGGIVADSVPTTEHEKFSRRAPRSGGALEIAEEAYGTQAACSSITYDSFPTTWLQAFLVLGRRHAVGDDAAAGLGSCIRRRGTRVCEWLMAWSHVAARARKVADGAAVQARPVGLQSSMICIARTLGAPTSVPAGRWRRRDRTRLCRARARRAHR